VCVFVYLFVSTCVHVYVFLCVPLYVYMFMCLHGASKVKYMAHYSLSKKSHVAM
jgi:hypothetical protein